MGISSSREGGPGRRRTLLKALRHRIGACDHIGIINDLSNESYMEMVLLVSNLLYESMRRDKRELDRVVLSSGAKFRSGVILLVRREIFKMGLLIIVVVVDFVLRSGWWRWYGPPLSRRGVNQLSSLRRTRNTSYPGLAFLPHSVRPHHIGSNPTLPRSFPCRVPTLPPPA